MVSAVVAVVFVNANVLTKVVAYDSNDDDDGDSNSC